MIVPWAALSGCASPSPAPKTLPTTRPATAIPAEQATPQYWLALPNAAGVTSVNYDRLWNACADTARQYQFRIDRTDYRGGLLITRPEISKQFFELWRDDTGTAYDVLRNSLQTIRRTIRFQLEAVKDGAYVAHPQVLVEKLALVQRRITSVSQYQNVFNQPAATEMVNAETGATVPTRYWYAIGRDDVMEKDLAEDVSRKLR